MSLYERIGQIASLSFVSSLFIGMTLLFFAVFNDYIYVETYNAVMVIEEKGVIGGWVSQLMLNLQETIIFGIPGLIDILWGIIFLFFVITYLSGAYFTKREGYFSSIALMVYGIMIILFIMTIFTTLSTWFKEEFINVLLPNLAYATPFFNLYLQHIGVVNITLIVIGIILNFVDFDIAGFNIRKQKEEAEVM